ncbi:hypothetical protein D3C72_67780 [compost metagenome]
MSLSIFTPLLYLLFGLLLGQTRLQLKGIASAFLTKVVIPLVIIYNLAAYRPGLLVVVLGVMFIMAVVATVGGMLTRDPIRNLCFFYLNIGWLGMPVATALFGDSAASLYIAAYIGSTIFGNSVGAGMLEHGASTRDRLIKILKSPPVISVMIGIILLPVGNVIVAQLHTLYEVLKFLLGFIGMLILGLWLAESKIQFKDIKNELLPTLYRSGTLFLLLTLFVMICSWLKVSLVMHNLAALYLICLLPPAANIIVLETHYRNTGDSAKIIASGTCISIVAIFVYAMLIHRFHAS